MTDSAPRSLEVRLTDYAASLHSVAEQIVFVAQQVEAANPDRNPGTQALRDSARLQNLIADDLGKLLAGEELKAWKIEGTL